jgi:integrase
MGYIKELPIFKDEYTTQKTANSRPWFNSAEYSKLHNSIAAYAKKVQKVDSRKYAYALELYDFVIFATNTGMRIGELRNCKISDVKIVKEKLTSKEILIISNIDGKRGKGTCQSYYGAVKPFRDILKRRGIKNPSKSNEPLFLIHHRVMFNKILKAKGLKVTKTKPPQTRDFVSLRSTYICFRLLNGVPIYEIANNCRTSVAVIQEHYAKQLGGALLKNINRTNIQGWDY